MVPRRAFPTGGHAGPPLRKVRASQRFCRGRPMCRPLPRKERPAAAKREAAQCDARPDEVGAIRHGTAAANSQKTIACLKASPNRSRHRYADPRPRGGPLHRSAPKRFFSLDRPQPVSLFGAPKREMGGGSPRRGRVSPPKPAEWTGRHHGRTLRAAGCRPMKKRHRKAPLFLSVQLR